MSHEYIGYDYKEMIAKSNKISFLIDCYENFGWNIDENIIKYGKDNVLESTLINSKNMMIRMKRNRNIMNKMELTRLQRNFEACINEIERLENSKTSQASVYALSVGILGTIFMAGAVFAVVAQPPKILLCILLAIPAFAGWIFPFFIYKREVQKKEKIVTELIGMKYDEIHELCEKGRKLLL